MDGDDLNAIHKKLDLLISLSSKSQSVTKASSGNKSVMLIQQNSELERKNLDLEQGWFPISTSV